MPHATRRRFLEQTARSTLAASAAGLAGAHASRNAAFANDVASTFEVSTNVRQLFLDDVGIASFDGLRRMVNPPTKHPENPLIKPDTPWERGCQVYGTACYDEQAGRFRMWYLTGPKDRGARPLVVDGYERPPHTTLVAYAESDDGVQWTKPDLGQFPYDGDRHNNLVLVGRHNTEGISVLFDPRDPDPARRWKALFWDHGSGGWEMRDGNPFAKEGPEDGIWIAFAPDGLAWTNHEHNPVLAKYSDTNQVLLFDPRIERYVAYGRFGFGRRLARMESADFLSWSEPALVLECDEADGPGTQIYGAGIDLYEGMYLAMVWIYREGGDGKIDTQLAASRDGINWTRVGDRATWLTLGEDESWEGGMVRSVERIIIKGDQVMIYYCGVHGPHGRAGFPLVERKHPVQIGLLTTRRDGFVSLDAADAPGTLVTRAFSLPQGNLHLNVDATGGQFAVDLCDEGGNRLARSELEQGDHVRTAVALAGQAVAPGSSVQLRVTLRNAKLYSYWFEA